MDANGVVLVQGLPATAQIQSITTSSGACTQSRVLVNSTLLKCDLGVLLRGQSWTVTVVVVNSAGSAKTAARVRFNGTDPVPANNYYLLTMLHNSNASGGGTVSLPPARPIHDAAGRKRPVAGSRISGPQN
jgi:Domain of unknown function DUF11